MYTNFTCIALNMALQYAKYGAWADYTFGERAYALLSLASKSMLAWPVFEGSF